MISYDEFKKVEIRAGKILSAEKIPDTDKLLKLTVDFGEYEENVKVHLPRQDHVGQDTGQEMTNDKNSNDLSSDPESNSGAVTQVPKYRQIVSGISMHFPDPAALVGKTCMFVTNLEPRIIRGFESNGMIFAVSTPEGGFSLLEPNGSIPPGAKAS